MVFIVFLGLPALKYALANIYMGGSLLAFLVGAVEKLPEMEHQPPKTTRTLAHLQTGQAWVEDKEDGRSRSW